jgi:CBS domain-containing protein
MSKIAEIMDKVLFTTRPDATVGEVIKELADARIGWIPIVDEEMHLLAYLTDGDIVRHIAHRKPRYFDYGEIIAIEIDEDTLEEKVKGLLDVPIREIAGKKKIYATVDQEIDDVADIMKKEHIRQIAVLENNRVVGLVRERDIVRHILTMLLPQEKLEEAPAEEPAE